MTTRPRTVLAWHFLPANGCLARSAPPVKVEVGRTYRVDGEPVLCEHGLHGSLGVLDALKYAHSPIVCRVRIGGKIVRGDDKLCGTTRRVLAMADAGPTLHLFACWCAERALKAERKAGREPDARSWAALEVKRRWIAGEATDAELAAARAAARAAVGAAGAAGAAAWAAAWAAQNRKLTAMLRALLRGRK